MIRLRFALAAASLLSLDAAAQTAPAPPPTAQPGRPDPGVGAPGAPAADPGAARPGQGTLPPANPPVPTARGESSKPKAPEKPLPRGAVLEEVAGTVRGIDRKAHRLELETPVGPVSLTMDRNTLVYTPAGLGTVLDLTPGLHVRAGRNADFLAYWVGIRASPKPASTPSTPGQGTGPGGGTGAPPEGTAPGGATPGGPAGPATGPGSTVGPGSVSPGPGGAPAGGSSR